MENKTISNYDKLLKVHGSFTQSEWVEQNSIEINESWKETSQLIALKILRTLRVSKLKQVDLANKLSISPQLVNKWVKGKENFTLETIRKLEVALGITLVDVPFEKQLDSPQISTFFKKERENILYPNLNMSRAFSNGLIMGSIKLHGKEKYGKNTI